MNVDWNVLESQMGLKSEMKKLHEKVRVALYESRKKMLRKYAEEFVLEKTRNKERTIKY